jgi:hypothetical protein
MENNNRKIIDLEIADEIEKSGVSEIALVDIPAIDKLWMAFRSEEFVKPSSGESEDEFIPRCMSVLVGDEGKDPDQAYAICNSMWEQGFSMQFEESYDDYPEAARENAQRALNWAEENGWGDCGTPIGKARANQLAKGEPISADTIARMASFERHRQNSETPYGEGCGKLMWDAWGGSEGVEWAQRKLSSIRTELSYDVSALPAYVDEVTEDKSKSKTMKFEEMDIFGYKTRYFYICPGAKATFGHLIEMNPDLETQGMVRSAALIADRVFEIEANVLRDSLATMDDFKEATILVEDFMDLMNEIDEEVGMVHEVGYMMGHLEVIASYLEGMKEDFAERPISRIPKEERGVEGSEKNKPGDTKTTRGGIEVSQEVESTLKDKIKEHNEKNPQDSQKADLGMLKAVWRRGSGAYSVGTPGRKGMTRSQWAMGRVNAFLKILSGSAPSDKDYTQDNDLLPKSHPKHAEEKMSQFGIAGENPYDMPNRGYAMSKMMFQNEDEQILVGPVMLPDIEIIRKIEKGPDKGNPYWVRFSKETIAKIAEKFMRENRNHGTNVQHQSGEYAGTYIMESWLVENEQDKANTVYGLDVPVGSWIIKARVTDPNVWKQVKAGKLNGWSVEGSFMEKSDYEQYKKDRELYDRVIKILKSV